MLIHKHRKENKPMSIQTSQSLQRQQMHTSLYLAPDALRSTYCDCENYEEKRRLRKYYRDTLCLQIQLENDKKVPLHILVNCFILAQYPQDLLLRSFDIPTLKSQFMSAICSTHDSDSDTIAPDRVFSWLTGKTAEKTTEFDVIQIAHCWNLRIFSFKVYTCQYLKEERAKHDYNSLRKIIAKNFSIDIGKLDALRPEEIFRCLMSQLKPVLSEELFAAKTTEGLNRLSQNPLTGQEFPEQIFQAWIRENIQLFEKITSISFKAIQFKSNKPVAYPNLSFFRDVTKVTLNNPATLYSLIEMPCLQELELENASIWSRSFAEMGLMKKLTSVRCNNCTFHLNFRNIKIHEIFALSHIKELLLRNCMKKQVTRVRYVKHFPFLSSLVCDSIKEVYTNIHNQCIYNHLSLCDPIYSKDVSKPFHVSIDVKEEHLLQTFTLCITEDDQETKNFCSWMTFLSAKNISNITRKTILIEGEQYTQFYCKDPEEMYLFYVSLDVFSVNRENLKFEEMAIRLNTVLEARKTTNAKKSTPPIKIQEKAISSSQTAPKQSFVELAPQHPKAKTKRNLTELKQTSNSIQKTPRIQQERNAPQAPLSTPQAPKNKLSTSQYVAIVAAGILGALHCQRLFTHVNDS